MAVGMNSNENFNRNVTILKGQLVWIDKTINHIKIKVPGLVERNTGNRPANAFEGKQLNFFSLFNEQQTLKH